MIGAPWSVSPDQLAAATAPMAQTALRPVPLQENTGVSADAASGDTIRDVTMTQPWPIPSPPRARTWPIAMLALVAAAVAAAALVVALTRPGPGSTPTYTPSERATAKTDLCEQYQLADDAASVETNGSDVALARVSAINAAAILQVAAADPAVGDEYRGAALALASSYRSTTAEGTRGVDNSRFKRALDDLVAKNQALRDLCGD